MDNGITIKILILAILILMSAYFSATETAFSSLNRIRIKNLANAGHKKARLVLRLSENYDKLLSTVLIGNNIVNIASASLATVIFVGYYGDAGVTISTIVMTIIVLIFGEISPKSLAKESPESFSMFSAPIIKMLIIIFTPLNYFSSLLKKMLSKMFKISGDRKLTEEELITIVEEAEQDGCLGKSQSGLLRNAIVFHDINVSEIFTPRIDVVAISDNEDKYEISRIFLDNEYTRLPVYSKSIDNIIGVINQKDFHNFVLNTEKSLESIIKPVPFISCSMKISELLKLLKQKQSHMAVIIDEYGGTMGIVTLEDIIEELVGEIWDEHDEEINDIVKLSDNEYRILCSANLDKMFRLFHVNKEFDFTTVGGWVLKEFGRIPEQGDSFTFENLQITVTKTEDRRVLEITVLVKNVF